MSDIGYYPSDGQYPKQISLFYTVLFPIQLQITAYLLVSVKLLNLVTRKNVPTFGTSKLKVLTHSAFGETLGHLEL